ncbi:MAG: hypothetical protein HY851_05715 [candidate division Zixibacteria bacterium]|nr:hypothetical protein [candidate division Zixibacteria bacterium]
MKNRLFLMVLLVLALAAVPSYAVNRVPRSIFVFGVHTGWSGPVGDYSAIGPVQFTDFQTITASDLFDPTYHLGMEIGRLNNDKLYTGLGIRYTRIDIDPLISLAPSDLKFHQLDVNLDVNFYPVSPMQESISPYFGPGLGFGFTSASARGYRSESQFNLSLNLNFGIDFRVWKATDGRSVITLSSMNSANILATGDRPKYVNIGGAFRYFFRP